MLRILKKLELHLTKSNFWMIFVIQFLFLNLGLMEWLD